MYCAQSINGLLRPQAPGPVVCLHPLLVPLPAVKYNQRICMCISVIIDHTNRHLSDREACRKDDQTLLVLLTCRESWRGLRRCLSAPSLLSSSLPSLLLLLCCSSSLLSLSLLLSARAVRGQKELTASGPPLPLRDLESRCTVGQQDRYRSTKTV